MTPAPIFSSKRLFKVWRYTVSHSQLLIVSNKDVESDEPGHSATRVELLFRNVYFMAVPDAMMGLVVTECDESEVPAELKRPKGRSKWYRLTSEDSVGYVAAGNFQTNEDTKEFLEPSALLRPPYLGFGED